MRRSARSSAVLAAFLVSWMACGEGAADPSSVAALSIAGTTSLQVGQSDTLQITARNASGQQLPTPPLTWSTADPLVATVDLAGTVTGVAVGQTRITARSGELSTTADIRVRAGEAVSITLSGPDFVNLGDSVQLTATGVNAWGKPIIPLPVVWTSSNPSTISVSVEGVIAGLSVGQASITGQSGQATQSMLVTSGIVELVVVPRGLYGDTIPLAPGQLLQLSSVQIQEPTYTVTAVVPEWSSTQPGVASVNAAGLVTAGAPGTAEIRAVSGSRSVTRVIRTAPTSGTVSVQVIHVADQQGPLTVRVNALATTMLAPGSATHVTLPAGTVQLTIDDIPLIDGWSSFINSAWHEYIGVLPSGTSATFVIMDRSRYSKTVILIPTLFDLGGPVHADSSRVQVVLTTFLGANVYFTPPGAPKAAVFLQGCYLDWPYGITDYANRLAGPFDVVVTPGKGGGGTEEARIPVSPAAGRMSTIVVSGQSPTMRVRVFPNPP